MNLTRMPVNYTPPTADSLLPCPASRSARRRRRSRTGIATTCCSSSPTPGTVAGGVFTQNRFCAAPVTVCRAAPRAPSASGTSAFARSSSTRATRMRAPASRASRHARATCAAVAQLARLRARAGAAVLDRRDHGAAAGRADRRRRCRTRDAASRDRWLVRRRARDHDDRHRSEGRVAAGPHRRRRRHGHRHREGRRDDPPRHGDDARVRRHRCADRRDAARRARARDRRRLVQRRDRRRRHVDQRQLRDRRDGQARTIAPLATPTDPRLARVAQRARRRSRSSSRRRSSATARARPSSSPSASKAAATSPNAAASRFAIAHSPLVKTAFFASDPNLGRIVCAIGNAGARDLDPGARVVLARRRARRRSRRPRADATRRSRASA